MNAPKLNWIDKAVAFFSAKRGFERARFRAAINQYEAAGRGPRLSRWSARTGSIQSDTRRGLAVLRARSRDMAQNNGWAEAAHREIPANIIATGITPHVNLPDRDSRAPLESELKAFFDSTACDYDGRNNLYGLQTLVMRSVVEAGEALVVRRRVPRNRIPVQFQILEPDYLDTSKDQIIDDSTRIIQGVEYRNGRRVAYWLFAEHPSDTLLSYKATASRRVPAADVLHIFRMIRPGQVRGVPWGAPVLLRLKDFDETADARVVQQKIAASFGIFWTDPAGEVDEDDIPERVTPGLIQKLPNGSEIKMAQPPNLDGFPDYGVFTAHEIAAGYGVPYSVLTGDVRQVNFSSGRMGDRAFNRNIKGWQRDIVVSQLCEGLGRWFTEAAELRGIEVAPIKWQLPKREMTDPAREVPPIIAKVRAGLCSLPEAIRQEGYDPDDVIEEIANFNNLLDESELVLDSDPRNMSQAGVYQIPPQTQED